jgi:peptidoglycan/xylan/chitin deacetylase (PgdA/CDA1 family)
VSFPPLRAAFYASTLGAIVTGTATVLGHDLLTRPQSGALLASYAGLVALGVTAPRSRIFADAVTRVPDGVALTFDDGPHPEHTPRVLDALDRAGARATFFMIGRKMQAHPAVVRDVLARGHAVGAHGYTHDRWYALRSLAWLARDADREDALWSELVGAPPVLFRPPIGLVNPRIARLAAERDRVIVAWTARPRDGLARTTPAQVTARVVPKLRDGAIVLLHDAAETNDRTPAAIAALPTILDAAAQLGLIARTVPEP